MTRPRKSPRVNAFAAAFGLLLAAGIVLAQQQDGDRPAAGKSFEDYGLILDRNIFDPQRRPPRSTDEPEAAATPAPPPVEHLDLLGTWIGDDRIVAIIDGNRTTLNTEVAPGAVFGGWRVATIDTDGVVLEKDETRIQWPVGHRIERIDEGDWELSGQAAGVSGSSGSSGSFDRTGNGSRSRRNGSGRGDRGFGRGSGGESSAPAVSSPPANEDEILRKMMERRQQEVGK
jgi:hypothetical protein